MRNNCFELGRARKIGSGTYISTTSKTRQAKDQTAHIWQLYLPGLRPV